MKKRKNKDYFTGNIKISAATIFSILLFPVIILTFIYQVQTYEQHHIIKNLYLSQQSDSLLLSASHIIRSAYSYPEKDIIESLIILSTENLQPIIEIADHLMFPGWWKKGLITIFCQDNLTEEKIMQVLQGIHRNYPSHTLSFTEWKIILLSRDQAEIPLFLFLLPVLLLSLLCIILLILLFMRSAAGKSSLQYSKYNIIADLSDELKNPLNAMNLSIQSLEKQIHGLEKDSGISLNDTLESIKNQFIVLSNLVNHLEEYGQKRQLVYTNVHIPKCIEEVVRNTPSLKKGGPITLNIESSGEYCLVRTDARVLYQLFQHTLICSMQRLSETTDDARITINIEFLSKYVKIEFTDNGEEMESKALYNLKGSFPRTNYSKTGIGLPIVLHLAEEIKGQVDIYSEREKKTAVVITVPYE